jgi:hypothetical protein
METKRSEDASVPIVRVAKKGIAGRPAARRQGLNKGGNP